MTTNNDANLPVREKVKLALAGLYNTAVFHASVLATMKLVELDTEADRKRIPTAATDCLRTVWYNPEFFGPRTSAQIRTVLAHEGLHKALMHGLRVGTRDKKLWNVAADYQINYMLLEEGHDFSADKGIPLGMMLDHLSGKLATLPEGGFMLDAGLDPTWSSEDIYDKLVEAMEQNPDYKGVKFGANGQGTSGTGDIDYDAADDAASQPDPNTGKVPTPDELARDVTAEIVSAAEAAKAIGQLPGGIARLVEKHLAPRVDWRRTLREFIRASYGPGVIGGDYTYRRPHRSYREGGILRPSWRKQPANPLVVAVDTSGSIGHHELSQFAAEIHSIIKDVRPCETTVLYVDADIAHVDKFTPDEEFRIDARGGGGTAFQPAFDYALAMPQRPACLVYLTDGYGHFNFAARAPLPTLWVMTTDVKAPWGKNIKLEIHR